MADAIVIGAGPNGLVAANVLATAGWEVIVCEQHPEPGGAVRSAELTLPGFTNDVFSAFYPLAAASPAMRSLELERYGLRWRRAPIVAAHPLADGRCVVLGSSPEQTAAALESFGSGDGDAWLSLDRLWRRVGDDILAALFSPFPPVRAGLSLASKLGPRELLRLARLASVPVRRLSDERFQGCGAGLLLAGHALHTDLHPEAALSAFYGWLLCSLGQRYGFCVPEGGAGNLTRALVRRLRAHGGSVECATRVESVWLRGRRAVGVRTSCGRTLRARRAVLGAISAPVLLQELVGACNLPPGVTRDLRFFEYDSATLKVDWALDGPIPWHSEQARQAGTIHVGTDMDALTSYCSQIAMGLLPQNPYLVMGQYSMIDPSRQPAGSETAWAYTHLPQRIKGDAGGELSDLSGSGGERFADRIEAEIEKLAPGFGARIRKRHILGPTDMQAINPSLVGGALQGGTAQLHQQLVLRPIPGLGRSETPIQNLYLASASAHPGGGVHGACGKNAARAALWHDRLRRRASYVGASVALFAGARRRRKHR